MGAKPEPGAQPGCKVKADRRGGATASHQAAQPFRITRSKAKYRSHIRRRSRFDAGVMKRRLLFESNRSPRVSTGSYL